VVAGDACAMWHTGDACAMWHIAMWHIVLWLQAIGARYHTITNRAPVVE